VLEDACVGVKVLPGLKIEENEVGPTFGHFLLHHVIVNVLDEALVAFALHILVACVACEMTANMLRLATSAASQQLIAVLASLDQLTDAAYFALFAVQVNPLGVFVVVKAHGTQKPAIARVTLDMTGRRTYRTGVAAQTIAAFTSMISPVTISLVAIWTPVVCTHEARHADDYVKMTSMQQQIDNFASRRA